VGATLGLVIYGMTISSSFDSSIQDKATNLGLTGEQTSQLVEAQTMDGISPELESTLAQMNVNVEEILTQAKEDSVASAFNTLGMINLIIFIGLIIISLGLLKLKPTSVEKEMLVNPPLQSLRNEV